MSWRIHHPSTLVERWFYGGPNALGSFGRYDGTLVNTPTWSTTAPKNSLSAIEFDGNTQHVNLGDITQLNAVSAFTLCFWMNQDVVDVVDYLFEKYLDASHNIVIYTDTTGAGTMYFLLEDGGGSYGHFVYGTDIPARSWRHVAVVFDGSQATNASRLIVYVGGVPITLTFLGTIPAATADLVGYDATIGRPASSFDGRFWDSRLYNCALSRDEVNRIIHAPAARF